MERGETLGGLAARYGVAVADVLHRNPTVRDPNHLPAGTRLSMPVPPGGALPERYTVQPGDTLDGLAAHFRTSPYRLVAANNLANLTRLSPGDQLWVPGRPREPGTPPAPHGPPAQAQGAAPPATPNSPTPTPAPAQAAAPPQAAAPQAAAPQMQAGTPDGSTAPAPAPGAQATPAASQPAPAQADAPQPGAPAPAPLLAQPAPSVARAPGPNGTSAANGPTPDEPRTAARTLVVNAQGAATPAQTLQRLSDGMAGTAPAVRAAVMADPVTQSVVQAAARDANQPLTAPSLSTATQQARTNAALANLDRATAGLNPELAGAVAQAAVAGHESFRRGNPPDPYMPGNANATESLMRIGGRITGTAAGDDALRRFAAGGPCSPTGVRASVSEGGNPAYALAYARNLAQTGRSPSVVTGAITAGMGAFQAKIGSDVRALGEHSAELNWLMANNGGGMTPAQLNAAVNAYRSASGGSWEREQTALANQLAADGSKLAAQLAAIGQANLGPHMDAAVQRAVQDPASQLALSAAIHADPSLTEPAKLDGLINVFTSAKAGDAGRKLTNELASVYVRWQVAPLLESLRPGDANSVAAARQAITGLSNERFARLLGVGRTELDAAVKALDETVGRVTANPASEMAEMEALDSRLRNTAVLKAFGRETLAGQLLRGIAVMAAGVSTYASGAKVADAPRDPQNYLKALVDAAGFAQKGSEILLGKGAVGRDGFLGQLGGTWKLQGTLGGRQWQAGALNLGRAGAGEVIGAVTALLDTASAVRSATGIGAERDMVAAGFYGAAAVGGAMSILPALGAAAMWGPVGVGIAAVGTLGNIVYQGARTANRYEERSKAFLVAGGYNPAVANTLGKRGGGSLVFGDVGASRMAYLARYAQMRGVPPTALQGWINSLTPAQLSRLSARVLALSGNTGGSPDRFVPTQPADQAGGRLSAESGLPLPAEPPRTDLPAFEAGLDDDGIPRLPAAPAQGRP